MVKNVTSAPSSSTLGTDIDQSRSQETYLNVAKSQFFQQQNGKNDSPERLSSLGCNETTGESTLYGVWMDSIIITVFIITFHALAHTVGLQSSPLWLICWFSVDNYSTLMC